MGPFVLRRLAASALLLLLLLTLTFFLLHLAPGDPAFLVVDPRASPEVQERLEEFYGLDRPLGEQYARWLAALLSGEWGDSFTHQRPVTAVLAGAVPPTLLLAGAALAVQYALGVGLGIAAARRAGSPADHLIRIVSLVLYSLPVFWLGLMAILALGLAWPVFPAGGLRSVGAGALPPAARLFDLLHHLALPALVLGGASSGRVARFARNSLLEVLGEDYIRAARARGLSPRRVLWVHALRNAGVPLSQLLGLSLPFVLSGSLVVEVVFSWPGLGRLTFEAIRALDYPLVLAGTAWSGILVVGGSLLADLLHGVLDPRVRNA